MAQQVLDPSRKRPRADPSADTGSAARVDVGNPLIPLVYLNSVTLR